MKSQSVIIQMKAIKQYFPVVLFVMLCKLFRMWMKSHTVCQVHESCWAAGTVTWCCLSVLKNELIYFFGLDLQHRQ